ncbi:DNA methyltransferase [Athalassotoga saccharophila]|uniref:Type III restriction-modification system methylation subunit n=1 Tax=Athalassotoga saccharophila TaxID=1441386 RepID=A0A6N4TF74_9BACT|nr:site-specific DNA-methyltransferase [Athalassotoga saccharophila]BBJ29124.1 type III restriction-modification system methylation subunit [Athalassotoga saccharophila]
MNTKEEKFYEALRNVFIGANVEGQGGFINLMKIKSNYYSKIEQLLHEDIESALKKYPNFRDELFDKLYSFFSRYFTESGSIYFNSTPFHNNIYEKVYTDDKDVILFWKTQMLYYVKTDRIFRSMPVEFDNFKFYFDASTTENKKANEKRNLIYELKEVKDDKTIVFNVIYSEKGKVTKNDDIIKQLKKNNIQITDEDLDRAFRIFEKQSEVDFFINKNAKAFLQEQFKLWSYQYFWEGAKEWTSDRVNELQILKDIAFKIIDFISQFEDELVKIWNKPKFVKNSNYVITLDRIKDEKLIEKILNHKNINEQIKEWQELGIVDEQFKIEDVVVTDLTGVHLNDKYKFLPIDTKYFKDLELEILDLFDDLDKSLDGWLIKSENYQALNTILPKFKEKVQTIYIDPPFNLDSSDQFLYRTNYKDANWATLLENRLKIAKDWLNGKGSIFVRCDYNGNWIVRPLMDNILGKENFKNEIIINKSIRIKTEGNKFPTWHDTFYFYSKNGDSSFFNHVTERRKEEEWRSIDTEGESWEIVSRDMLNLFSKENLKIDKEGNYITRARIVLGREIVPREGRRFPSQKVISELEKQGRIRFSQNGNPQMLKPNEIYLTDNWSNIYGYASEWDFQTENSEFGVMRCIESTSNNGDLILDFFLGSGTTTAVAHKLGRKWIGIEMGEHFYSVVLPRMKRVLFYDKSGISKDVQEYYNEKQAGGFFKYYELEQYEEALANCKYEDGDLFNSPGKNPYQEYVFMKDKKMLDALEIDYKSNKVKVDLSQLYPNIDIAETLSNLTGKWIKKISESEVEFEDGTKINIQDLDYKLIKPLIWWE